MPSAQLTDVFGESFRVLKPRALALVSFFGSRTLVTYGLRFDHAVVPVHELFPEAVFGATRGAEEVLRLAIEIMFVQDRANVFPIAFE